MFSSEAQSTATRAAVVLTVFVVLEVFYYPTLASATYRHLEGHGWDGSGLAYFRSFYVTPSAILFAVAFVLLMRTCTTDGRKAAVVVSAYVLNVVLFFASIAWYRLLSIG